MESMNEVMESAPTNVRFEAQQDVAERLRALYIEITPVAVKGSGHTH